MKTFVIQLKNGEKISVKAELVEVKNQRVAVYTKADVVNQDYFFDDKEVLAVFPDDGTVAAVLK